MKGRVLNHLCVCVMCLIIRKGYNGGCIFSMACSIMELVGSFFLLESPRFLREIAGKST